MADKNLHDIKIDDLEGNKKTPLKNILTLLALLFIILVISVVITKLILNTDDNENNIDGNMSSMEVDGEGNSLATAGAAIAGATGAVIAGTQNAATDGVNVVKDADSNAKNGANAVKDGAKDAASAIKGDNSNSNSKDSSKDGEKDTSSATTLKDRNVSGSKTKVTLRDHRPLSSVKELSSAKDDDKKESSSHKSPATATKHTSSSTKKSPAKSHVKSDRVVVKKHPTASHKSPVKRDRVVAKRSTSHTTKHSSSKSIGGTKLTPGYYIKIGTFKNPNTAVKKIKKTGLNYKLIKVKDDKTLTRVFIGTFSSKANAQRNLHKAKKISSGAYIIKK